MAHPKYELPKDDPHAKYHYEMAMKHVEAAKKAGKLDLSRKVQSTNSKYFKLSSYNIC